MLIVSKRWVIANVTAIVGHQKGVFKGKKVGLVHYEVNLTNLSDLLNKAVKDSSQTFVLRKDGRPLLTNLLFRLTILK